VVQTVEPRQVAHPQQVQPAAVELVAASKAAEYLLATSESLTSKRVLEDHPEHLKVDLQLVECQAKVNEQVNQAVSKADNQDKLHLYVSERSIFSFWRSNL
jgi:hypothetical protein